MLTGNFVPKVEVPQRLISFSCPRCWILPSSVYFSGNAYCLETSTSPPPATPSSSISRPRCTQQHRRTRMWQSVGWRTAHGRGLNSPALYHSQGKEKKIIIKKKITISVVIPSPGGPGQGNPSQNRRCMSQRIKVRCNIPSEFLTRGFQVVPGNEHPRSQ